MAGTRPPGQLLRARGEYARRESLPGVQEIVMTDTLTYVVTCTVTRWRNVNSVLGLGDSTERCRKTIPLSTRWVSEQKQEHPRGRVS